MVAFAGAAQANLVSNGDFEADWWAEDWNYGTSDGGYIGVATDQNGPSAPGEQSVFMNTEVPGGKVDLRSNAFALPEGETIVYYSFDYAVEQRAGSHALYQLRFFEGPGDTNWLGELNINLTDTDGLWEVQSGQFDIPQGAGYADIRISAGIFDDTFDGVVRIDNVSVVPEPATLALLGLGSLGLLRRKRTA